MTDNEIILALEHCLGGEVNCDGCPYAIYHASDCDELLKTNVIALIKHQQAKLNQAIILPMPATEELKKELYDYCCERCVDEL